MSLLYIKCIFIHQGSVFSSFFLAFFKFSAFFSLFSSVRGIIREASSFLFFLQFFSFWAVFLWFFSFYRPSCTFSVFYRFIWFHYNFSVFMVLIFFSRCHVFYPLFHLSGLPFSFFVNDLTFSLLSTFFIPSLRFLSLIAISHHFLAFHCLSLPFLFFSPMSILHFPLFSSFLPFLNSFLSFFAFSASSIVLHPLFAIFLDRPLFFRSTYVTLPVSFFTFHVSQNVSRETSFYDFRSSAINEKRFASRLSENHSHFSPLLFLKQSYFLFFFWFSRLFYIFPVFLRVSRSFSSLLSLFY